jgi:Uma2 family endonuclease
VRVAAWTSADVAGTRGRPGAFRGGTRPRPRGLPCPGRVLAWAPMMRAPSAMGYDGPGPFTADDLRPGSRYELHDGHPIYCAPTGGDGARSTIAGAEVLDSDPAVEEAGVDPGYTPSRRVLRGPDVAVGNVPDKLGWIPGVPPLALEYASIGQDEGALQIKIGDFLAAGTQLVWVVRLVGPRRVEVYEPGKPVRTLGPGEELTAPGILRNSVPVEALYDRRAAHEVTLRNLLQRRGYSSLDAVLEEGRKEGVAEGRASAVLAVLQARGIAVPEAERARILSCRDLAQLDAWLQRAASAGSFSDVLD